MNNPIDDFVKRNLADQEISPSRNLFAEKIQPHIEQQKAVSFPFMHVAAAVVLLLAGWMIITLINRPINGANELQQAPVAVEKPLVVPSVTDEKKDLQPNATTPTIKADNAQSPIAAQTPAATKKQIIRKNVPVAQLQTKPVEIAQETAMPTVTQTPVKKRTIKVYLKINPAKYVASTQTQVEENRPKPAVLTYAAQQIENIKEGEGLQLPPKAWFDLPKLAVRVEGNPLKGILKGKE
jgi:hypothetical protein